MGVFLPYSARYKIGNVDAVAVAAAPVGRRAQASIRHHPRRWEPVSGNRRSYLLQQYCEIAGRTYFVLIS